MRAKVRPCRPGSPSSWSQDASSRSSSFSGSSSSRRGRSEVANCRGSRRCGSGLERDDLGAQLGREPCLAQQAELAPASVKVPSPCAESVQHQTDDMVQGGCLRGVPPAACVRVLEHEYAAGRDEPAQWPPGSPVPGRGPEVLSQSTDATAGSDEESGGTSKGSCREQADHRSHQRCRMARALTAHANPVPTPASRRAPGSAPAVSQMRRAPPAFRQARLAQVH